MPTAQYSTCPTFPGEVQDYYCTSCHTPCSGLSLLVGPHTGHSRVPLLQAARLLPTQLRRDAFALVTNIQEEYVRPKTVHCATLNATLDHLQQEKQRKTLELQELQRELRELDESIDAVTQERTIAVCHWSRQRTSFTEKARRLLRGAKALAKIVGLEARSPDTSKQTVVSDNVAPSAVLPHHTLQAIRRELEDVHRVLVLPLEWLEREENDPRRSCRVLGGDDPVARERMEEFSWKHTCMEGGACQGSMGGASSSSKKKPIASDSTVLLEQLLAAHIESQKVTQANKPSDDNDDDVASSCDTLDGMGSSEERQSWRNGIKEMERLLRAGLDRCLGDSTPTKRTTTTSGTTGDEMEVNDISSSSSSGGSVSEAVNHLLRSKRGKPASTAGPHARRHSHSPRNTLRWEEEEEDLDD